MPSWTSASQTISVLISVIKVGLQDFLYKQLIYTKVTDRLKEPTDHVFLFTDENDTKYALYWSLPAIRI